MPKGRLLPYALVTIEKVDKPQCQHVAHPGAKEVAGGKIWDVHPPCAHSREYFRQRRRARHQGGADPHTTQAGQFGDPISMVGKSCSHENDRDRGDGKDESRNDHGEFSGWVKAAGQTPQSGKLYPARHEGPITMRRAAEGLPLISKKEEVSDRDRNCLEQDKPAQESPMGTCTALHHSHARHHRRL